MKTDSGLSAYCHGNADFPNVWERCWPTRAIPIYIHIYYVYVCIAASVMKQVVVPYAHVQYMYIHAGGHHCSSYDCSLVIFLFFMAVNG